MCLYTYRVVSLIYAKTFPVVQTNNNPSLALSGGEIQNNQPPTYIHTYVHTYIHHAYINSTYTIHTYIHIYIHIYIHTY